MKRIGWERVRVATAAVLIGVGAVAACGADIEVYKANEIEPVKPADEVKPVKPADDVKPAPPAPQPAPEADHSQEKNPAPAEPQPKVDGTNKDAAPRVAAGNLVEPLSNGLKLTMTMREIQAAFGEPTDRTFDSRTFGYPGFGVQCGGTKGAIWRVTIKGATKLHCGLGAGSTRAEVKKVLGSPVGGTVGQYDLTVSYGRDGKVDAIKIEPANGDFAPYEESPAPRTVEKTRTPSDLPGTWWGNDGLMGQIELKADGTWTSPNGAKGTYAVDGDKVTFTGPLAAWNKGQARLKDGRIEFGWTNADGSKNYFSFSKR